MRVIRADAMGFCFGVRDALDAARRVEQPTQVTIYGELVHNPQVNVELTDRGFHRVSEAEREQATAATPHVLITAHGISDRERRRLEAAGHRLVDTTCPLVRRAHDAACRLAAEGRFVLVIGRRGHVEVRGLTGDLDAFDILESPDDARPYPHHRIGVVCQTTTEPGEARRILAAVERLNPHADIRFRDTICAPTRARQDALERLIGRVDVVIAVGGPTSNNTRRLEARCRERGMPAYRVAEAAELRPEWFAACHTVGLTAGTSTPDDAIDSVEAALRQMKIPPRMPSAAVNAQPRSLAGAPLHA